MSEVKFTHEDPPPPAVSGRGSPIVTPVYAANRGSEDSSILYLFLALIVVSSGAGYYGWREYRAMQRQLQQAVELSHTYEKTNNHLVEQNKSLREQLNAALAIQSENSPAIDSALQGQWEGKSDIELYRLAHEQITKNKQYAQGIQLIEYILKNFPATPTRENCLKLQKYAKYYQ